MLGLIMGVEMKVKPVAIAILGLLLLGAWTGLSAEVTEGEYFQISDDGEMVRIYACRDEPYPKCDFRFEHPDGTTSPITDAWIEDLAEMRGNYAGSGNDPAPSPEPVPNALSKPQSCNPTEYAGIQPGSVPPSDDLMRQLIRDYFTGVATDGYDVSVQIHGLEHGDPFINAMSILEDQGATLQTNGAPQDAVIYPMRVQLSVCEEESQYSAQVRAHDWELYCFVNNSEQWACGVSQSY